MTTGTSKASGAEKSTAKPPEADAKAEETNEKGPVEDTAKTWEQAIEEAISTLAEAVHSVVMNGGRVAEDMIEKLRNIFQPPVQENPDDTTDENA